MNSPFQGKLGDTFKNKVERATHFLRPIGLLLAIAATPMLIALALTASFGGSDAYLGQPSQSNGARAVGEPGNTVPRLLGSPTIDGLWVFGVPTGSPAPEALYGAEPVQSGDAAVATGEIGGDLSELESEDFPEALALIEEDRESNSASQAAASSPPAPTGQQSSTPGSSSSSSAGSASPRPASPSTPANPQPSATNNQPASTPSTVRPPAAAANPTTSTPASTAAPRPAAPASTAAPTPAPTTPPQTSSGRVLLNASLNSVNAFSFGQDRNSVTNSLEAAFGDLTNRGSTNWDDWSVVANANGNYLRTRSGVGNNSQKQFNVPIQPSQEAYLVYDFYLEPGFDAGDGNGSEGRPSWGTGIKMPGLMRGNPGDNTGGNHTAGGFSGRLMIRGTNSSGSNSAPRDGLSLAAYVYGQEINNQSIASGYGEDYYFLDGFNSRPFEGISSGMTEGVGDPRIWDLREGQWVTVVLGYRVDGDNGWFKAWTSTGGGALQPRLHIPNINWTGGNRTDGPDSLIVQNFWGGSGSVWYPDSVSYMRFRDFGVFTTQADALAFAR